MRIYVILVLFSFNSKGQALNFEGKLFSQSSHNPIPYASIKSIKLNKIIDADKDGEFKITASAGDSLLVTCIGYHSMFVQVDLKKNVDSIYLEEKVVELPSITVRSNVPKLVLGIVKEKLDRSFIGESGNDRYQLAVLIKIPDNVRVYRLLKVRVKQEDFSEDWPVLLHVYTVDSFGLPGIELLRKNTILCKDGHISGFNEIIVKDQDIILEDTAIFVGVQFLNLPNRIKVSSKVDIGFAETFRFSENITYRRGTMQGGRWHTWYENAMIFPFDGVNPEKKIEFKPGKGLGRPINLIASAEIEVLENK